MDFDLTDEQELLRDTTREVLARIGDIESRNKIVDSDLGWSREVWAQLADIGILGLGFDPEESGQIEIMVVLTEVGRRLAPEPVAAAALIPGGLIAELGNDEPASSCSTRSPPASDCWPSRTQSPACARRQRPRVDHSR